MSGEPPIDRELDSDAEPSEEELQAANALRQALEGRPGGTHLPQPALETAAFLRASAEAGRLTPERHAALRAELLASLPPTSGRAQRPHKGWRHWLGLGLTLAGGVTAVVVIGVIGARQLSEPAARQEARMADARSVSATAAEPAAAGAPAEAAPATPLAERAAPLDFAANSADENEPAAKIAAAPSATAQSASKMVSRGASGAGAPGGGASPALARRGTQASPAAPMPHDDAKAEAEARDEDRAAGIGAAASPMRSLPQARGEQAPEAKKSGAAQPVPTEQVQRASDKYRSQLLAELADPRIDGAYAEADRAQSKAELESARARLDALSRSGLGTSADAERLRPDVYCRLAEVALRLGQPQAALDWARRGLALGAPASPFVARLYLLEGRAKSALGDDEGAAKSYLNAIQVNEQLLDESLDGP